LLWTDRITSKDAHVQTALPAYPRSVRWAEQIRLGSGNLFVLGSIKVDRAVGMDNYGLTLAKKYETLVL